MAQDFIWCTALGIDMQDDRHPMGAGVDAREQAIKRAQCECSSRGTFQEDMIYSHREGPEARGPLAGALLRHCYRDGIFQPYNSSRSNCKAILALAGRSLNHAHFGEHLTVKFRQLCVDFVFPSGQRQIYLEEIIEAWTLLLRRPERLVD
ncbi:uncharacterized protein L969DRAFT_51673 [Mixia osmundae IAM 14324]|uniref:Uncharacterized protein n=1 Tax=Mixia osmundae (strain CBS 9802 / IAM 14324 / JCM 22182 / KY 12970) TaxID=764103 RepID=G7DWY1_MIXOS|nr:uncharacterized protein L969DRAFT_51673 [Mixia osmundae IAM 14324]KEI38112.1 hypothetical protein L969DRAFT_51673 [Mixia osmundae IAM 14324]GAA95078.1 hypothetical protein E5Q_01733 [Mixia osmundae IAM 14324]